MRYPASNWKILHQDDFTAFAMGDPSSPLEAELCVQFNRGGQADGCFKMLLNGSENILASIPAASIIMMGGSTNYRLIWERRPRDIVININSMCSDWEDVAEEVTRGSVTVELAGGGLDTERTFLKRLLKESRKTANGAAFRWAVAAAPNGFLELQLQTLPAPANVVSARPVLRQDNIAVVVAKVWQVFGEAFDGQGHLGGPIPTIFTEQPEELRAKLEEDPQKFLPEFNRIASRYVSQSPFKKILSKKRHNSHIFRIILSPKSSSHTL